ncbi:aromatic ring-hydroxylating oxygenase subunit alpha [Pusillimonas noertemannii]|uniref:aromatic ring-hydroxylating oxygenase subunit alpha n=1 Tax=Pusillimonas noertemannii TaxID=305977 RepID=UPI00333FEFC2
MLDKTNATAPNFDQVKSELDSASHAPGYVYASPEAFQREIDEYFMKDWLYVGREEELPEKGDYLTMRLVGEPVIIARSGDGSLNAFYNMCVHRGVEVAFGNGNTRAFKCPYHGWTYDLGGKLKGATHMEKSKGFDASTARLKPIRLETWHGNIFICFSPDTRPFAEFISEFENDFAFLRMQDCRLGNKTIIELDCNWKLVHENLMDFYHVNVLHAGTFGGRFTWDNDNDVILKERGGVSMWYKAGPPTPGAEPLLGKMPWLEDRDYSFSSEGFLQPNLTLFGRVDCARPFVVWPLSESKCQIIAYQLFPKEVFERPDIRETLKIYEDYLKKVLEEDRMMIESLQKAMSTRGFVPGPMSVLEKAIHHFLNGHIERVLEPKQEETADSRS